MFRLQQIKNMSQLSHSLPIMQTTSYEDTIVIYFALCENKK